MKRILLSLILLIGVAVLSYSQDLYSSKIIIYRESNFVGSPISYQIMSNESPIVKIKNGSYYVHICNPGVYNLTIDKHSLTDLRINAEMGKTYYVRFGINSGSFSASYELRLVDSLSAAPIINSGKLRWLDDEDTPMIRPRNRIGVGFILAEGLESRTMFKTPYGRDSKISCGGGLGVDINYGLEFSRYFDLSISYNKVVSELDPLFLNEKTTFTRNRISIKPAFIIPIMGGDMMRVKIGGGFDYYFNPLLTIRASKLDGGFDDDWEYKNTVGVNLGTMVEINFNKNWSLYGSCNYYNVFYEYLSGNIKYSLRSANLRKPDGSEFDMRLGIGFHF